MKRPNRILSLLLAVMLCFSALPFSVSADELSNALPTESSMENLSEQPPAEKTEEPPSSENTITISDSSGDVPVLYAIDPFEEIQNITQGGTDYLTQFGISRAKIVAELEAHENDDYYLGTPYMGGDWQSPNGDPSYNDCTPGMNCTGFVSYVLRKVDLDTDTFIAQMYIKGQTNVTGSGRPYDVMCGASNFMNLIQNADLTAYSFKDKQQLLSSGQAEKGDIILMWWSHSPGNDGADNHIGFFWGDSPSDDKMWHSNTSPKSGNQISAITPKTPGSYYVLIKVEPPAPKEYTVTLTKTSADVSITQGNSAYSLAGATYNVYKGTSGTGNVVATFTTDEAGHATLSTPLEDGTYSVKEVTPPKGYKLDTNVLIELKTKKLTPEAAGQLNMYLNYYAAEVNDPDDNPPIGIILCTEKDSVAAEYALGGLSNNIFASRYVLYMPDKEQLIAQVEAVLKDWHEKKENGHD